MSSKTRTRVMTAEDRAAFERDGYLMIRGALSEDEVARYTDALDRVYRGRVKAGQQADGAAMHLLGAVTNCPDMAGLIDHPATFPLVWPVLGWNIHVYHSHLDVHPPLRAARPFRYEWHQDGGRQNREIETRPRPRLSVKLGYWLCDVSGPGRGNLKVVPGSHLTDRIDGPPRRDVVWPDPPGAVEVTAGPGDVVFFDRRIWHARSDNYSPYTRKAVFFGYTYRWTAIRDEVAPLHASEAFARLSPVQRQLLGGAGDGTGDHAWGHDPQTTPLYRWLGEQGLFDSASPPLRA
jgi:ectoine hydroxylase